MTILRIDSFTGMIPRIPPERLPDGAAAYAKNCYFGNAGEMRSMRGPGPKRATSNAVRSIFTDDGQRFYAFPTYTRAYLSPTIDDQWSRVYFCPEAGGLRLTSIYATSGFTGMRDIADTPGSPNLDLKVGVPRPTHISAQAVANVISYVWVQVLHDEVVVKETSAMSATISEVSPWYQYRLTVNPDWLTFPVVPPSSTTQPEIVQRFRFCLKLTNASDGAVHFDGHVSHEDEGSDTFLLTIPQAVSGNIVTAAFVATVTNVVSEESAPTSPVIVETRDNGMFVVSASVTVAPPVSDQLGPTFINLYRTYPGTTSTYFFVGKVPYVNGTDTYTFTDVTTSPQSAITLAQNQAEWDEPPSNIKHLTYAGNGIFCGSVGKDLYFSEPYRPHAWPYRMIFPSEIKGVIEVEGGVLVTTTTRPYFVYGSHPSAMTQQGMAADQAGVSSKSMCRIDGTAIYAGFDGLVRASAGQVSIEDSRKIFDRTTWKTIGFVGSLPHASLSAWDGRLFYVHDNNLPSLIFTPEDTPTVVVFDPGQPLKGVGVSAATDTTYLLFDDGFAEHGVGADLPLEWHSKTFDFPEPVSFGAVVVDGAGSFTIEFGCDGQFFHTETLSGMPEINGTQWFRLPARRGKKWYFRVIGTGKIRKIEMGSSYGELRNG